MNNTCIRNTYYQCVARALVLHLTFSGHLLEKVYIKNDKCNSCTTINVHILCYVIAEIEINVRTSQYFCKSLGTRFLMRTHALKYCSSLSM